MLQKLDMMHFVKSRQTETLERQQRKINKYEFDFFFFKQLKFCLFSISKWTKMFTKKERIIWFILFLSVMFFKEKKLIWSIWAVNNWIAVPPYILMIFFRPVILEAIHILLLRNGPYLNSLCINIISSLSQNNVA